MPFTTSKSFNIPPRVYASKIPHTKTSSGTTALVLSAYKPVSGNWCWISPTPLYLRYVLGHGWRLSIIFITLTLYVYLFSYIHRHFKSLREISSLNNENGDHGVERTPQWSQCSNREDENNIYIHNDFEVYEEHTDFDWDVETPTQEESYYNFPDPAEISQRKDSQEGLDSPPPSPFKVIKQEFHPNASSRSGSDSTVVKSQISPLLSRDPLALIRRPPPSHFTTTATATTPPLAVIKSREIHIQKLLLLNAYPIGYVLLISPGIMNRFVELSGGSSRTLAIAQASTQFVGLANACEFLVLTTHIGK